MEMISVSQCSAIWIPPAVSPPWIVYHNPRSRITRLVRSCAPSTASPKEASVTKAVGARVGCVPHPTVTPTIHDTIPVRDPVSSCQHSHSPQLEAGAPDSLVALEPVDFDLLSRAWSANRLASRSARFHSSCDLIKAVSPSQKRMGRS